MKTQKDLHSCLVSRPMQATALACARIATWTAHPASHLAIEAVLFYSKNLFDMMTKRVLDLSRPQGGISQ